MTRMAMFRVATLITAPFAIAAPAYLSYSYSGYPEYPYSGYPAYSNYYWNYPGYWVYGW
jgi:hypothetical protein